MLLQTIAAITIFLAFPCSHAHAGESFYGTVQKVIDGDSLLISSGTRRIEVRLYGLDAPEYRQPFCEEAKNYVGMWGGGQEVKILPEYADSYGRTVAVIVKGEKVLNNDIIQAGLAWVYPRYCQKTECEAWLSAEKTARNQKKGLWADSKAVAPWKWKRQHGHKQ
jgi:micrococcal nuclease